MNIGKHIRKLRREMGLTQEEFSKKVKLHAKQLARYEAGRTVPSAEVIIRVAQFCNVTTDYLILGSDKELAKKHHIFDPDLVDMLRRIDQLPKSKRELIKWAIQAFVEKKELKKTVLQD